MSKAYIKAMSTEEIEDVLRANLTPAELEAAGIPLKKPVLLETPENNGS
jgi:hypothetical protein